MPLDKPIKIPFKKRKGKSGPGRTDRQGVSVFEMMEKWGTKEGAESWLESVRWPDGQPICPKCGKDAKRAKHKTMPYWCKACRKYFSLKTGTAMQDSKLSVQTWILGVHHDITHLKGVSSMHMSRHLEVAQKNAWHLRHRIREAFMYEESDKVFASASGTQFQVDEAYIGGREGKKHSRDKIRGAQGGATKQIVIGITEVETGRIWADVIPDTKSDTIAEIIERVVPKGAVVYTDEGKHYKGVNRERHSVNHSRGEYVRTEEAADGMHREVSTNNTESAWSTLKRSIVGVHHKMSPKHLRRYVKDFTGRWNIRNLDTEGQMRVIFQAMVGRNLTWDQLTEDNGLPSGSGPNGMYYPERRRRYQERA